VTDGSRFRFQALWKEGLVRLCGPGRLIREVPHGHHAGASAGGSGLAGAGACPGGVAWEALWARLCRSRLGHGCSLPVSVDARVWRGGEKQGGR